MSTNQTNWAQRNKDALAAVAAEPEMKRAATNSGTGAVNAFYQFTEPEKEGNKQLLKGDTIEGVYLGSPVSKTYGNPFHKIQTTEGIIALPSASSLNKQIATVAQGAKVKVVYGGKEKMTGGKYAGKSTHVFEVFASQFKDQD
jgi:hypothetical protein